MLWSKEIVKVIDWISTSLASWSSHFTYIVGETKHNFRCTVPTSCDIFSHESLVWCSTSACSISSRGVSSCKTEVANFQFTVGIDQEITRFEVPVEDICGMDVFETTQGLIDEGLEVGVGKRLL